jgi:hypothetical protein
MPGPSLGGSRPIMLPVRRSGWPGRPATTGRDAIEVEEGGIFRLEDHSDTLLEQ